MRSKLEHSLKPLLIFVLTVVLVILIMEDLAIGSNRTIGRNDMSRFVEFQRPRYNVDCKKIINMDPKEHRKAKSLVERLRVEKKLALLNDTNFIFPKSKCDMFKRARGGTYLLKNSTADNDSIRLAFSILVYDQVEQLERLLHALYRPQNFYCIHVDKKSPRAVHQAVKSIADCFDNVFIASKLETVVYAGYSRLQADINCIEDLNKLPGWSYFVNLASSEFPLRTNYELTSILRMYNGASDAEIIHRSFPRRVNFTWKLDSKSSRIVKTNLTKQAVPYDVKLKKGYAYVIISRRLTDYVIKSKQAKELLFWLQDTYSPDETFWATLLFNTQLFNATGFRDKTGDAKRIETMSRYAAWKGEAECKGMWRHGVCVFSVQDLPSLVSKKHFVVNKLKLDYDPVAYQCIEEWYEERRIAQEELGIKFYSDLNFYCEFIKARSTLPYC